jgi:hypothetical protein
MSDGPFIQHREREATLSIPWNRWAPLAILPVLTAITVMASTAGPGFVLFGAFSLGVAYITARMPSEVSLQDDRLAWKAWFGAGERSVMGLYEIRRRRASNGDTIELRFADGGRLLLLAPWKAFEQQLLERLRRLVPELQVTNAGWGNAIIYGYRPPS